VTQEVRGHQADRRSVPFEPPRAEERRRRGQPANGRPRQPARRPGGVGDRESVCARPDGHHAAPGARHHDERSPRHQDGPGRGDRAAQEAGAGHRDARAGDPRQVRGRGRPAPGSRHARHGRTAAAERGGAPARAGTHGDEPGVGAQGHRRAGPADRARRSRDGPGPPPCSLRSAARARGGPRPPPRRGAPGRCSRSGTGAWPGPRSGSCGASRPGR